MTRKNRGTCVEGRIKATGLVALGLALALQAVVAAPPAAAEELGNPPAYLKDRGTGIASSMFGTYIRKGDLIIYPYWEYYLDNNREYKPQELGFGVDKDFRGRYRESEYLFFLAYGLTDFLAFQTELAGATASLKKSPADSSALPSEIKESGLTSFETQARWRWLRETERRSELWGYLDVVYPINKKKLIIGSDGWDVEWGTALTRGFK
ncbi:MAG: hypothetical protein ACRENF_08160, partial [Thermodesulfobacteriota bacterium]